MKSTNVFGKFPTGRWELQSKEDKGKPTMADEFLGGKEIKNPKFSENVENVETLEVNSPEVTVTVSSSEDEDFGVLKAAVGDYISGDITFEDLKAVFNVIVNN